MEILREIPEEILKESLIGTDASEAEQFMAVFRILRNDVVASLESLRPASSALDWFAKNIEHNVPGGKLNRGMSVLHSYKSLIAPRQPVKAEIFKAMVLGWAVEWLQAFFLVADDIMDSSITRRGQPCWYRMEGVGHIAINDSFLLESCIYKLLRRYLGGDKCYLPLVELFHEITWKTEVGQLHDLIAAPENQPNFDNFTMENYKRIVTYKTAYYSFYLPVTEAMLLAGLTDPDMFKTAEHILIIMGEYFQVQDDYLDCYGAPEVIGKIGTDIADNKCTWLLCQALLRADAGQRKLLEENYGRTDAKCVAAVKSLYGQLELVKAFNDYEESSYTELLELINKESQQLPKAVFLDFINKIFKRQK